MNDKVAAAVERLRERFAHVSGQALSYESINVPASDVETILAELGRLSVGEPKHVFEIPVDRYDWTEDGMEIIAKNQAGPNEYVKYEDYEKLYNTRPPALGELSDTVLFNLYAEMNAVYVLSGKIPSAAQVAKAAREFLGKVDA